MRTFGILFLIGYLVDATVSIVATVVPSAENVSMVISYILLATSLVVLVLAGLNKLQPRGVFLLTSGYDLFMWNVSCAVAVVLAIKLGPQAAAEQTSQQPVILVLQQQLPGYLVIHWTLLLVWVGIGLYGLRRAWAGRNSAAPGAKPPPLPSRQPFQ